MKYNRTVNSILSVICIAVLFLSACSQATPAVQPAATSLPVATVAEPASATAPEPTTVPTAEPGPTEAAPMPEPTSAPTAAPTPEPIQGASFDYMAIPIGMPIEFEVDKRIVSILVKKVTMGSNAEIIARAHPAKEMQFVIVQLLLKFVSSEDKSRAQLLKPEMFDIVSKGHLKVAQNLRTYTPSPRIFDVKILPGQSSLGYVAFQIYKDDPAPLLRFTVNGKSAFFDLTEKTVEKIEPEKDIKLISAPVDKPVPFGTPAYVNYQGVVYKITVEKSLRGFAAWMRVNEKTGSNKEAPIGKEYLMPYVSVQIASTPNEQTEFKSTLFSSYSHQTIEPLPVNKYCPMPCFQSAVMFPGGSASGWFPVQVYKDDPAPLLVFNQEVYFEMVDKNASVAAFQQNVSLDAISYDNRDKIHKLMEFKQAGPVNVVVFTPDDKFVLTAGDDKLIHVWEVETGKETAALKGHIGSIRDISFSADGKLLASTAASTEVLVWDTTTWEQSQKLAITGYGLGVKFLADDTLATIDVNGSILYWDVQAGTVVKKGLTPRSYSDTCIGSPLWSFDTNADGTMFAASLACGFATIWNPATEEIIFTDFSRWNDLYYKRKPVDSAITLSPDGSKAAFGMVYYIRRKLRSLDVIDLSKKRVVASVAPMNNELFSTKIGVKNDIILAGVSNQVVAWWPEAYTTSKDNLVQLDGPTGFVTSLEFSNNGEILAAGDYSGKTVLYTAK